MAKFIDENGQEKGEAVTLMRYFKQPGQTTQEFNEELKALTPESKTELAVGAAKNMGWQLKPE